jgi:lipopolysaccharide export system protein LptA
MRKVFLLLILSILSLASWSVRSEVSLPANAKIPKSWTLPYYQMTDEGLRQLQSISEGSSAETLGPSLIKVTDLRTRLLKDGSQTNVQITLRTPECLFNINTMLAYSSNRIEIVSPTTNVFLRGRGFFCSQTNSLIVVSNDVETAFRRSATNHTQTTSGAAITTITEVTYRILSDHLELQYESNLVVYSGRVHVIQDQLRLDCDRLTTRFVTNRFTTNEFNTNSIEEINAQGHVVITSPEHGRATGDHAIYTMNEGNAVIELTGNAFWTDGARESRANQFNYDRGHNRLVATDNAVLRFPDTTINQTNLIAFTSPKTRDTNQLTELHARKITIQLPSTNGPIEGLLAEGSVIITNRHELTQATADKALYTRTNETFLLSGNPICKTDKGEIKGQTLVINRLTKTFKARGGSFLKFAINSGMTNTPIATATSGMNSTNRFIQVTARDFDYTDTNRQATFTDKVHGEFLQSQTVLGTLDCNTLNISFGTSNQIRTLTAKGNVRGNQPAIGNLPRRTVLCEELTAERWPDSPWLRQATALGDVNFIQVNASNVLTRFRADSVDATFAATSNRIVKAIARDDVWAEQRPANVTNVVNLLNGQRAVLSPKEGYDILELTGNPWAVITHASTNEVTRTNRLDITPPERMIVENATQLLWNLQTHKYSLIGPFRGKSVTNDDSVIWMNHRKPTFRLDPATPVSTKP